MHITNTHKYRRTHTHTHRQTNKHNCHIHTYRVGAFDDHLAGPVAGNDERLGEEDARVAEAHWPGLSLVGLRAARPAAGSARRRGPGERSGSGARFRTPHVAVHLVCCEAVPNSKSSFVSCTFEKRNRSNLKNGNLTFFIFLSYNRNTHVTCHQSIPSSIFEFCLF